MQSRRARLRFRIGIGGRRVIVRRCVRRPRVTAMEITSARGARLPRSQLDRIVAYPSIGRQMRASTLFAWASQAFGQYRSRGGGVCEKPLGLDLARSHHHQGRRCCCQYAGGAGDQMISDERPSAEFFDLVRARSIIGRLPLRRVPFRMRTLSMYEGPRGVA